MCKKDLVLYVVVMKSEDIKQDRIQNRIFLVQRSESVDNEHVPPSVLTVLLPSGTLLTNTTENGFIYSLLRQSTPKVNKNKLFTEGGERLSTGRGLHSTTRSLAEDNICFVHFEYTSDRDTCWIPVKPVMALFVLAQHAPA